MPNPLLLKLGHYVRLSEGDRAALLGLWGERPLRVRAGADALREGDAPRHVLVVTGGWACRYKHLEDGRRHVMGLLLPGDLCDLDAPLLARADHSVGAVTALTLAQVAPAALDRALAGRPRLLQALRWEARVAAAIQREWSVSLASRTAFERIGHLLCETFLRLEAVGRGHRAGGRGQGGSCEFPVTQALMADITGLSAVHVSRTVQALREAGLVRLGERTLAIPDLGALMTASLCDPGYLHLGREGRHLDAEEGGAARPPRGAEA